MSNTIRIKRSTGTSAPESLANAELAYSEGGDSLYIGVGTGGAGGSATSIRKIASSGLFSSQSATHVYAAPNAAAGSPSFRALVQSDITGLTSDLAGKAGLSGATFTGAVSFGASVALGDSATATTQPAADNSTKLATTAFVKSLGYSTTTGTVTSVGLSLPSIFTVSGSPVTGSGTLTAALATQAANIVFAGPTTGSAAAPGFRSLVVADIPTLTSAKISDFDTQVRASRLDQMAAPTADVSLNNRKITGLAEPTSSQDAATKGYVDALKTGLDFKDSVKAATTGSVTLSGAQTIDGVSLVAGDRVLVKNQSPASLNGIYVVASGAWGRSSDFDADAEVTSGAFIFVEQGAANADSGWVLSTDGAIQVGVTSLTFTQFSGAGQIVDGAALSKTGNTLNVVAGTGITVANDDVSLTGRALALHNLTSTGIITQTGAGTYAGRSLTHSGSGVSVANGDGVSGNPTVSLSTALSTIGGLTPAADRLPYYTSGSEAALAAITAYARSLLDDADAASARTTLALGSLATQNSNSVSLTGGAISGVSLDNCTIDGGTF